MIFCHDKREYMTLGEYMEKYPIAYAEAVESMTAEQKALFAARFEDRYIYLPKDETSDTGENFSISANVTFVTPNADNPKSIPAGGTAYWKYTVDSDAEDPVIAVTGCEWVAPAEGMIFLFNPNGNITITVTASLKYYTITTNGENCGFSPSTGKIQARGSQQMFIIPATNYKWNGTLTVTGATAIKNVSGSYITLVNPTGDVTVSATCDRIVYPLTVSGINCTPNPKPEQIAAGGTLAITYTAAAGYDLPEASGVGVTGCSFGWNQSTGVLTLYNPTGAVAASVVAVAKSYAITATVTNGTATGANVIHTGETVALTIAANEGHELPDTVTVTGASQTWNKETGTLTLTNPTGAVTVSAVCAAVAVGYNAVFDTKYLTVANTCFYSVDDGSTWIDCKNASGSGTKFTITTEQIKLKCEGDGSNNGAYTSAKDSNNNNISALSLYAGYNATDTSVNYTLTDNITIECSTLYD